MSATQTQLMNRIPDPLNSQHREVCLGVQNPGLARLAWLRDDAIR